METATAATVAAATNAAALISLVGASQRCSAIFERFSGWEGWELGDPNIPIFSLSSWWFGT